MRKLTLQEIQELKKCQEEPWYFYNKYVKPPEALDITREDWELHMQYPLTNKECYKPDEIK